MLHYFPPCCRKRRDGGETHLSDFWVMLLHPHLCLLLPWRHLGTGGEATRFGASQIFFKHLNFFFLPLQTPQLSELERVCTDELSDNRISFYFKDFLGGEEIEKTGSKIWFSKGNKITFFHHKIFFIEL